MNSSETELYSIPLQKYIYLYTCANNNVAKYATNVSMQQMYHILQQNYHL